MVTALSLEQFLRGGVDIAVIETGLGGRLDATNCLSPILTLTTEISYDHVEILGRSLSRIAREKAGIIKSGVPHLIGHLPIEALGVIKEQCRKSGSRLHRLSANSFKSEKSSSGYSFSLNGWRLENIRQSLLGEHQIRNSALVLKAVTLLRSLGFSISDAAVRWGLKRTVWPGRFQVIRKAGTPTIIVDVCHNTAGTIAFVKTFKQLFPARKASVIIGLVKRKEHAKMLDALMPVASEFHVVRLSRRSADVTQLAEMLAERGGKVTKYAKLGTALKRLLKSSSPDDIIAVVGSHYLAGEFLKDSGKR